MIRNFFSYLRDSVGELRQVAWPSRRDVLQHTALIIVSVVIAMLIISLVDYGLGEAVNRWLIK